MVANFFSKYPARKYKKGEIIYKPGDNFEGVSFVKNGYIRVYLRSKEGKETSLQFFKPLFYLSLVSLLTQTKNKYYIEAMTPVMVTTAPKDDWLKFVKSNPIIDKEVMADFLNKFSSLTANMLQIIGSEAKIKIIGLIYSLAQDFGVKKGEKIVVKFKVSHKLIASMTGLTRETVTLQMLKLQKMGLIKNEKREIVILDRKKMIRMLGN